ncbi:hypothetical protein Emed_003687 [Eimeria media]
MVHNASDVAKRMLFMFSLSKFGSAQWLWGMSLDSSSKTDQPIALKRDVVLSSSSPQESVYPNPHKLNGVSFKRQDSASCRQHGLSWWPFLLSLVFVFFVFSICHHNLGSNSVKGIQVRRLAEGGGEKDDDLPSPSTRDIAELCEDWSYSFPSPGEARTSPGLVEAVLASVEEEVESGARPPASPSPPPTFHGLEAIVQQPSLKRLLYGEGSDDEDYAGPSSKVARTSFAFTTAEHAGPPQQYVELRSPFPQPPQVPPTQYQAQSPFLQQPSTSSAFVQQPYTSSTVLPAFQEAFGWYRGPLVSREGPFTASRSESLRTEDISSPSWTTAGTYTSAGYGHAMFTGFEHVVPSQQYVELGSQLPPPPQIPLTQYQAHGSFVPQPSTSSAVLLHPYATYAPLPAGHHAAALSSASSASSEGPSNPAGSPAAPAPLPVSEAYPSQRNPPVRLPELQPGVVPRLLVPGRIRFPLETLRSHVSTILMMRKLFRKKQLSQRDVDTLLYQAEILAGHAFTCMYKPIYSFPLSVAVEQLGRRYLVFRALFLTAHIVKQDWWREVWWFELGHAVPSDHAEHLFTRRSSQFNRKLALDLSAAIRMYKSGISPTLTLEKDLMKRLFCEESSPRELKNAIWEPLRQDYEDSSEESS